LISEPRKNQLAAWRKRLLQHVVSPSLLLKRVRTPRRSIQLFIAPFVDKKLTSTSTSAQSKMLAHAFQSLVLVKEDILAPFKLEVFEDHFQIAKLSAMEEKGLGVLFDKFGSDKRRHDYDLFYEKILIDLLNRNKDDVHVFEIGLGTNNLNVLSNMGLHGKPGASLRAFCGFSERVKVVGADIDKRVLFQEERIQTFFVDQLDVSSLLELQHIAKQSHLIIDDGLHNPEANLNVLVTYKDMMQSGSWLVIEDISPSEFNLRLWQLVQGQMHNFKSGIFELPNAYVFIAQKI
jgi:hypothetical protein